jgi:hypothetical protein
VLAQLAHLGCDQRVGEGRHLDRLLAQHEPGEVEIVDGHVAQEAARHLHVADRRNLGVAAGDDHLAQIADLAGADRLLDRVEGWIVAPVEADLDRHAQGPDLVPAGVDLGDVEVDRLLAQDRLAGPGRGGDQLDVRVRGRGDQDGLDRRIGQHLGDAAGRLAAVLLRHSLGRGPVHVVGPEQRRLGMGGQIVGVHAADAAAAEERETDHWVPPCSAPRRAERQGAVKWSGA